MGYDQRLITPETTEDIYHAQLLWLSKVQALQPNRPLKYQYSQGKERWKSWVDERPVGVIELLNISTSEVVFDIDTHDWDKVRETGRKLEAYFRRNDIPFIPAWSGGKGMHYSVFLGGMALPDTMAERMSDMVEKRLIDISSTVRKYFANKWVEESGVDKEVIDMSRVNWSSYTNGALLRTFGGQKKNGGRKTVVGTVPTEKESLESLRLRFPREIRCLDLEPYREELLAHISDKMDAIERYKDIEYEIVGEPDDCPCFVTLRTEPRVSARNAGAFTIALFCKEYGYPLEKACAIVRQYSRNCYENTEVWERAHQESCRSAYRGASRGAKCDKIRETFGEDICVRDNCPKARKHETTS